MTLVRIARRARRQHDLVSGSIGAGRTGRGAPTPAQIGDWISSLHLRRLPSFVTPEQFLDAIAEQRGRSISLLESSGLPPSICGVWLARDDGDTIVVDDRLTGPRRDLVIMHEAAHVLFDHQGSTPLASGVRSTLLRAVGKPVDASTVLTRSHFDDHQEWQAEWLATYFLSRTRHLRRASWLSQPSSRYAARILNGQD